MKHKLFKICYSTLALIIFISSVPLIHVPKGRASSYRTKYTIYGDFNNDKVINSFDVVVLARKISSGKYDKYYDLNCDEMINTEDVSLLQEYILGNRDIFEAYYNEDTDGDEISDFSEIVELGTDPDSLDTDNDGLSDYHELSKTKTSPFDKYSNGTNISDGDLDSDSDGLTNKEEVRLNTDPLNEDSDYDGLLDNEEIITYKTDPIKYDSDSDSLSDGDEIRLNLNPLKIYSDDKTKDGDIITKQEVSADSVALADFNKQNSSYDLSVSLESTGYAENNLCVDHSAYRDVIDNSILVCEPIDISYNRNLKVNSASINYTLDNSLLNNHTIEDYMIFKYTNDTHYLLPVKTYYNGKTLYTKTTELGTFCVCDLNKYAKKLQENNSLKYDKSEDCQLIFAIDLSPSSVSYLDETGYSILTICNTLFSITNKTTVDIYGYYWNTSNFPEVKRIGSEAMQNIQQVYSAFTNLSIPNAKSTNPIDGGIDIIYQQTVLEHTAKDNCAHKYAFVISNSDYSLTNDSQYKLAIPKNTIDCLKGIKNANVDLSIVLSKENFKSIAAIKNLKDVCKRFDFNVYPRSISNIFISCAFENIYKDFFGSKKLIYSGSMIPIVEKDEINYYDFISSLPQSYDVSKVPYPNSKGMISINDALLKLGITTKPSLYSVCEQDDITAMGLDQLCEEISEKILSDLCYIWSCIPISPVTTDYIGNNINDTSLEFKDFSSELCYPPTYYNSIKPVNKSINEEKVNGETIDGVWVPWS